eukprot:1978785-Rhodomonas_salina.1
MRSNPPFAAPCRRVCDAASGPERAGAPARWWRDGVIPSRAQPACRTEVGSGRCHAQQACGTDLGNADTRVLLLRVTP